MEREYREKWFPYVESPKEKTFIPHWQNNTFKKSDEDCKKFMKDDLGKMVLKVAEKE